MDFEDYCEMKGCDNVATRITTTETKMILICETCWKNKYRIQDVRYNKRLDIQAY